MTLSTKVKGACERMVFEGLSREEAAKAVGLADTSLRLAFRNPVVLKHYNELIEVLRSGERPKSIHKIADLRDGSKSDRIQLEAAKYLDGGDKRGDVNVSVNVANIVPGYIVDVSGFPPDPDGLKRSGSSADVLDITPGNPSNG